MITDELIQKINYLARKKRYEGLTEEEAAEQKKVREIYLEGIRQQVRGQLDALKQAQMEHSENTTCNHDQHHNHNNQENHSCSCHKCKH